MVNISPTLIQFPPAVSVISSFNINANLSPGPYALDNKRVVYLRSKSAVKELQLQSEDFLDAPRTSGHLSLTHTALDRIAKLVQQYFNFEDYEKTFPSFECLLFCARPGKAFLYWFNAAEFDAMDIANHFIPTNEFSGGARELSSVYGVSRMESVVILRFFKRVDEKKIAKTAT